MGNSKNQQLDEGMSLGARRVLANVVLIILSFLCLCWFYVLFVNATRSNGELTADNEGLTSSNGIYEVDRNGQIVLEKLDPGTYIVTETKAPDGYVLNELPQTVVVNPGDTQTLVFGNPPKGNLVIHKLEG